MTLRFTTFAQQTARFAGICLALTMKAETSPEELLFDFQSPTNSPALEAVNDDVMGGYFRLYPHARGEMVIPPFFFGLFSVVPAVVFLGWWFILQFFNGTLSLLADPLKAGGVAWWAHIGGFVFGSLLCSVIKVKRFYRHRYEDEDMPW